MDKWLRLGLLLDWYGALLTDRQRATLEQSLNEDCSLAEIAEREGVSRRLCGMRYCAVRISWSNTKRSLVSLQGTWR